MIVTDRDFGDEDEASWDYLEDFDEDDFYIDPEDLDWDNAEVWDDIKDEDDNTEDD